MMLLLVYIILWIPNSNGAVTHTYDLSTYMPSKFVSMFSVSWYGIGPTDPQGPGPDSYTNHWSVGAQGTCIPNANPSNCSTEYSTQPQRQISSRYRPLAGIYSSSGKNLESQRRIDLMLSTLRNQSSSSPSCDYGHARLDAWSIQLESIQLSSKYLSNPSLNVEIPYQAYIHFLQRSKTNSIIPGYDSTWLYSFSSNLGLGKCDNSNQTNSRDRCLNTTIKDFVDIVKMTNMSTSYLINQKPVIFIYTSLGGNLLNASEWSSIWTSVR
ncbi:unnamed protein product, partial [Didymodactylos carnosus]